MKKLACEKHNRILIGKKYCVDCKKKKSPKRSNKLIVQGLIIKSKPGVKHHTIKHIDGSITVTYQ